MKNKLIYALAAFTLTFYSCSTDEQLEIKPSTSTKAEDVELGTPTNMCPNSIRLVGNNPDGNKVQVVFDKDNSPALVRVVANGVVTADISAPAGKSGEWISTDKYLTTTLGLELFDESGVLICNCVYDNAGQFRGSP